MLNFLDNIDLVCFVDGYDVVCVRDLNELKDEFLKIQKETNCKQGIHLFCFYSHSLGICFVIDDAQHVLVLASWHILLVPTFIPQRKLSLPISRNIILFLIVVHICH